MSNSIKTIIPDKLNDSARFALTAERHTNAFRWIRQDWIPLALIVNNPEHSKGITMDNWLDHEIFIELQAKILRDSLEVGSDIAPSISLLHMGNALNPSVFGAKITIPNDRATSIADSGPWIFPVLKDINEVDKLERPAVPSALLYEAERYIKIGLEHLPEWVKVVSPASTGPLCVAELLRGTDFYVDLAAESEKCQQLLEIVTDSFIDIEKYFRDVAGQGDDEFYSQFGIRGLGLRLGEDTFINISPDMIERFVLPNLNRVADAFGGQVYVHFCSLENSRSEHVYEVLINADKVFAVSSQFAFEYYEKNVDRLEGRLAIESFYGSAYDYIKKKHGSFEIWANDFVPRFKSRSGLVLYFEVPSIDEGKRLWEIWQSAHQK